MKTQHWNKRERLKHERLERERLEHEQQERQQLWQDRFCQLCIGFLVGGLMSRRQPVRERCAEVLIAFGADVTDRLQLTLRITKLSPTHRKRISAVIASVADRDASPDKVTQLLNSVLCMIRHNEMQLVQPGLSLSRYLPRGLLTNWLVDEALKQKSDSRYFDRILRAVETVNEKPSQEQSMGLLEIYYYESGPIQRSCKRLLEKIDRGEIGDRSWAAGFRQHHLTAEDLSKWPDENVMPIDPFPELSDPMWLKGFHYHPSPTIPRTS